MKVRIKEVPEWWECDYLSKDKIYDFRPDVKYDGYGSIINDGGRKNFISIDYCSHLNYGSWEIIPDEVTP